MTAADSALTKLTKLGKLSVPELRAKAAVFRAMMKFERQSHRKVPRDFLATFAIEIEQYFREAARNIPSAVKPRKAA